VNLVTILVLGIFTGSCKLAFTAIILVRCWLSLHCVWYTQCKHVLAAKLSEAMQSHSVQSVTDEHLSALINAMNWYLVFSIAYIAVFVLAVLWLWYLSCNRVDKEFTVDRLETVLKLSYRGVGKGEDNRGHGWLSPPNATDTPQTWMIQPSKQ